MLARQDETSSRRGGVGGNMYLLYHNQIANCKQPEAVAVALTLPLTLTVTLLAAALAVAADWRARCQPALG